MKDDPLSEVELYALLDLVDATEGWSVRRLRTEIRVLGPDSATEARIGYPPNEARPVNVRRRLAALGWSPPITGQADPADPDPDRLLPSILGLDEIDPERPPRRHVITDVEITPELARAILARNLGNSPSSQGRRNRAISQANVDYLAKEIRAGRWGVSHQGLAFDWYGTLIDGQHRAAAVVEADKAIVSDIAYNLPPDAFERIDSGRRRTTGDVLGIHGYTSTPKLAAVVKGLYCLDLGEPHTLWSRFKMSSEQTVELLSEQYPDLPEVVKWAERLKNSGLLPSAAAISYYVIKRAWPDHDEKISEFYDALVTGAGMQVGDPRLALRNNLLNSRANRRDLPTHLALTIKAWNSWVSGKSRHVLSWRGGAEEMPHPIAPARAERLAARRSGGGSDD